MKVTHYKTNVTHYKVNVFDSKMYAMRMALSSHVAVQPSWHSLKLSQKTLKYTTSKKGKNATAQQFCISGHLVLSQSCVSYFIAAPLFVNN